MKHILSLTIALFLFGSLMQTQAQNINGPVLLPVKDDPTISFRIWFKTGAAHDPAGKAGLAQLTAAMLTEAGTKTNTYEQILSKLYPMAASYESNVDKEMTVISGRIHREKLNDFYPLFMDAILQPAFSESDFKRIKTDMLNYIEKSLRYSNDEELGKAVLYDFVFAGTAYGSPNTGRVSDLKSITLNDVKNFYRTHFTRGNVVVGLGGGYDDGLPVRVQKDLAKLPAEAPAPIVKPAPAVIKGLQVRMVEKECEATAISFGFPIEVLRGSRDFFALALFCSWFGEHRNSSSHLYQVIREARGMNYGDYSYIEIFPNGGRLQMPRPNNARSMQLFEVWLRPVQNRQRHFALRAAMRELHKVIDNGMTQEEFDLTQKFLLKYALHYATTTSERLGYAIDSRFYGIDGDYIDLFRAKIHSFTLEEVNAAIKKYLNYDNVKIAVVTKDAKQFADDLVNNTQSPITYDTPKPQSVLDEDKEIEVFPLAIRPENINVIPVDKIFEK
jgi:zinc protease